VLLAFLGNLFVPLSGAILDITRFTPVYGYSDLAHSRAPFSYRGTDEKMSS